MNTHLRPTNSMKRILLILSIAVFLLASCSSGNHPSGAVIEINISDALKNVKDFKLGDLVEEIELLELEASNDRYIGQPSIPHFGKKYILVFDYDYPQRIFLFHRDGSFACEVGKKGKGPGEHEYHIACDMDPAEEHVVVSDMGAMKVMIFNIAGELVVQKDLSSYFELSYVQKISWDLEEGISFIPNRPFKTKEDYASIVIFDKNLNLVNKVLPRSNNDSLDLFNISYYESFSNGQESFFWECFFDTVYQYDAGGTTKARYYLELGENKLPFKTMKSPNFQDVYHFDQPMTINWVGNYLYMILLLGGSEHPSRRDIFFDTDKDEAFTISHVGKCMKGEATPDSRSAIIENDLFGFEPVTLNNYFSKEKVCIQTFPIDILAHFYDLDCIRNQEVKYPEIRDRLIRAVKEPQEDDGTFLVIMHVK